MKILDIGKCLMQQDIISQLPSHSLVLKVANVIFTVTNIFLYFDTQNTQSMHLVKSQYIFSYASNMYVEYTHSNCWVCSGCIVTLISLDHCVWQQYLALRDQWEMVTKCKNPKFPFRHRKGPSPLFTPKDF